MLSISALEEIILTTTLAIYLVSVFLLLYVNVS